MPREPKPWFRKDRNCWYVQIEGRRYKLGEDKPEADREFYRLMAAQGKLSDHEKGRMTVADACEQYLRESEHAHGNRENTVKLKVHALSAFAGAFGHRRLDAVRPAEVLAWLAEYRGIDPETKSINDSTRALYFRIVKQVYRFARDTGLLEIDPFVLAKCRWSIRRRNRPMSDEEYEQIMSIPRLSAEFRRIVEFVWTTGMRPGELCQITGQHLDPKIRLVRLDPHEYKTGSKTHRPREVPIPAHLWEWLVAQAAIHRRGPLFRKKNGTPWTQAQISIAFNKLKVRHGLTCVLYQARHRYVTRLLEHGEDDHRVARMAGHASTHETLNTYWHPEVTGMIDSVERVMGNGTGDEQKARIEARIEAKAAEREARAAARAAKYVERRRLRRRAAASGNGTNPGASGPPPDATR